jgi:hypothetical protein
MADPTPDEIAHAMAVLEAATHTVPAAEPTPAPAPPASTEIPLGPTAVGG